MVSERQGWTNGKPFIVTAEQCRAKWDGHRDWKLRCYLCRTEASEGDTFRWVYMNSSTPSPGNFMVCRTCDFDGIAEAVRASLEDWKKTFGDRVGWSFQAFSKFHSTIFEREQLRAELARLQRNEDCVQRLIVWAAENGWNGVDNSKILDSFIIGLFDELRAELAAAKEEPVKQWRCYHCDQVFTDPILAAAHFGDDRNNPKPAACEGLLNAYAEAFERYGVHRNHHNAASVKQLANKFQGEVDKLRAERDQLAAHVERLVGALECVPVDLIHAIENGDTGANVFLSAGSCKLIGDALAATPAQALEAVTAPLKAHIERLEKALKTIDREMSDIAEGKQEEIRNDLTAGESHGWTAAYDHVGPIVLAALAATPAQSLAAHDAAVKVAVLDQIKARLYALASKEQDQPYGYDMNPRQWAATCLECAAEDVTAMQDEIISEADRIEKEAANG